ncbi:MAG: O-antigen polymerase [Clostridia bacterium]|nr:O-antigen polymerase [Clostridia bacterium]
MTILENSLMGGLFLRLWIFLNRTYERSGLCALLRAVTNVWKRWFRHSAIMDFLLREGTLPKSWKHSIACRAMNTVLNLPAALLHWVYRTFKRVFDHSFFASLGFAAASEVPAAIGWVMLGILVVPYKQWDNLYSLLGFALMAFLFLLGGMRRRGQRLDFASVGPYAVLFAFAVVLSWPVSAVSALSLRYLFFHVTCMLCVAVTVSAVERPDQLTRLAAFASLGTLATSVMGVVQRIQGVEVNASYVDLSLNEGMPGRVFAVFENPNAFAEVLVMLLPLAAALVVGSKTWKGRVAALFPLGLGIVALAMTYGRASYIGFVVSVLVFVFLWKRKIIPALLLLGVCALPLLPDTVFNRILTIFNTNDTSTSSRFPLYEAALRLVAERPVRGAGLGGDAVRFVIKEQNLYHGTAPFVHAHNTFLQIWLETGLLGIVSFFAAMVAAIKSAGHAVKHCAAPNEVRVVTIGAAAAMAGVLVNSLADYLWNYPRVMVVFWFVFAILLAGVKLCKAHGKEQGTEGRRL